MKKPALLLMALAATVALTIAGCGGDDEGASSPPVAAARDRGADSRLPVAREAVVNVPAVPATLAPAGRSREEVPSFPPAVDARGLDDDSAADTPDASPDDAIALVDSDGDGVHDELDAFPQDPAQWTDRRQRRHRR